MATAVIPWSRLRRFNPNDTGVQAKLADGNPATYTAMEWPGADGLWAPLAGQPQVPFDGPNGTDYSVPGARLRLEWDIVSAAPGNHLDLTFTVEAVAGGHITISNPSVPVGTTGTVAVEIEPGAITFNNTGVTFATPEDLAAWIFAQCAPTYAGVSRLLGDFRSKLTNTTDVQVSEFRLVSYWGGCSTAVLPGAVGVPVGDSGYQNQVIGSSATAWTDGSDDTYAVTTSSIVSGTTFRFRTAIAKIGGLPLERAKVYGATINLRASATNSGSATGGNFVVGLSNNLLTGGHEIAGTIPTDGVIRDLTISLGPADIDVWDGLTPTAASLYIGRRPGTGDTATSGYQIRVYGVSIVVSHECPPSGRPRRRPLRQFPRDDGLGMSSARRQVTNRSMQASLRRGGGVYF